MHSALLTIFFLAENKKHIAILGSTGSIGRQALEVISLHSDLLAVSVLTGHRNADLLVKQAREFLPHTVVIADESLFVSVRDALADLPIQVWAGQKAVEQCVELPEADMVLTALVGFSGLRPTLNAIRHGKHIALANKETMVVAGELVNKMAREHRVDIIPVDSEHSAIFQCLIGEVHNPVEKIYLTASGGPFRGWTHDALRNVTPAQALKHPNWEMGSKITIDSASMMNKGLEVIEARWLFDLKEDKIDIIVHPQSIIHSLVQFTDGSIKAQMGLPDMRLPIQYALAFPQRVANDWPRFNFANYPSLTFETVDVDVFQNIRHAYRALREGGNLPCILNAANEVTVKLFLEGAISFTDIARLNGAAMEALPYILHPSLDDLLFTDEETRLWVEAKATSRAAQH